MGIFLLERKLDCGAVSCVLKKLGFSFFLIVPPIGRKGVWAFCWRPSFCFNVLWKSKNVIHLEVQPGGEDPGFLCLLVYGPPVWKEKECFWKEMRQLAPDDNTPWLCLGDFNDIVRQNEKQGGRKVMASGSPRLHQFTQSMGFVDLGFVGFRFTWCNKRPGLANIRDRLDLGISNMSWRMAFPNTVIHHYSITNSDHVPIILSLFDTESTSPKPFKFELFQTRERACYGVVAAAWTGDDDSPTCGLLKKIWAVCYALRQWNRKNFGKMQDSIKSLKDQLAGCQLGAPSQLNLNLEADLQLALD